MNFADFHFAEPRWLWLAAIAPVLLVLLHTHAAQKRRAQLARMASPDFVEQLTASHSPARRRFKNILLLLAFALAGLALARPQWGSVENGRAFVGELPWWEVTEEKLSYAGLRADQLEPASAVVAAAFEAAAAALAV